MKTPSRQRRGRRAWQEGRWAEHAAALWLMLKGYRVLERRFKTSVGEIDLIVRRGKVLCFVEVKKRVHMQDALYSITHHQQNRFIRAAQNYLKYHPFSGITRFDCVVMQSWGIPHHIPNIVVTI